MRLQVFPKNLSLPLDELYDRTETSGYHINGLYQDIKFYTQNNETKVIVSGNSSSYAEVLRSLNFHLKMMRKDMMHNTDAFSYSAIKTLASIRTRRALWEKDNDFFSQLRNASNVSILSLSWPEWPRSWPLSGSHDSLSNVYHTWSVTDRVCSLVDRRFTKTCQQHTNVTSSLLTSSIMMSQLNLLGGDVKETRDAFIVVTGNAWINQRGYVRTRDVDLVPNSCKMGRTFRLSSATLARLSRDRIACEEEVFVISQFWGYGFFHFSAEDIPRIAPYLEFLWSQPQIKIHVIRATDFVKNFFRILNLEMSRVITGDVCAKIVYSPQGGNCGNILQPHGQILSHIALNYTHTHVKAASKSERNLFILIKRSGRRKIRNFNSVINALKPIAAQNGLVFKIYDDHPVPKLSATLRLFHNAAIVVAPHGAGLSNMLFSHAGLYVIEVLCADGPGPNLCYANMAHTLGHYYHGMAATSGCNDGMYVDTGYLKEATMYYLRHYKTRKILETNLDNQ